MTRKRAAANLVPMFKRADRDRNLRQVHPHPNYRVSSGVVGGYTRHAGMRGPLRRKVSSSSRRTGDPPSADPAKLDMHLFVRIREWACDIARQRGRDGLF